MAGQRRDYVAAATAFRRYLGRGGANFGFVGQYVEHLAAHSSTGSQEQRIQHERTLEQAATFMLRSKQYAEAKQHFESLEKLAGPDWWRRNTDAWETASDYGETYEGLNDFHTALTWYDRGIQLLERNRLFLSREELKIALASQRGARYLYFNAARAALRFKHQAEAAGDHESAKLYAARAFGYGESGRARALLDLLATDAAASPALDNARRLHARITTWRSLLGQMIEREQANTQAGADRSAVADLQNRIARDEQALAEYESQLAGSAEAAPLDKRGEVLSMADVTRMLQPGTCLLQYYFMSDDLLIWVIDGNGMLFSLLATQSAAELTVAIEKFRGECESQLPGRRRAAELARILIEPLKEVLPQYQRIVIVPHGAAHHLPFHLLPLNGEPFGLQFDITYLPSASVLRYIPGDWPGLGSTILAVGNPTGMAFATGEGHEATPANSLPGTTIEARAIALMFPHSLLLLGDEASKGNVLRDIERCGVLHFATHGRLDGTQPALSGLLLANGEMLNVYELSGLHLKANLVTLSACDTGRGQSTGGDDVLGLSRAFFSAGAQYLVVSLWPVDDATAMVFMLHFYRILRAGSAPAEAMRMAQAELRSLSLDQFTRERDELLEGAESSGGTPTNWGTPYYWGPFVVIGKP